MKINQAIIYAAEKLQQARIEPAHFEARILLKAATNKSLEQLFLAANEELSEVEQTIFLNFISRRLKLEPIAYIVGYKEFYGYKFIVNNKVLIPRPDTEVLIDAALQAQSNNIPNKILDIGTGSGCIIITLLHQTPFSTAVATDISIEAIEIAGTNAKNHQLDHRLELIHGEWFDKIMPQKFDLIVSNPPYIAYDEILLMAPETILYEPEIALFAQDNGLSAYHIIASQAKDFLTIEGKILVEIGFLQTEKVIKIFKTTGYNLDQTYKDLAENIRVVGFTWPS